VGSETRSCVLGKLQTPKFGYFVEIVVRYGISFAVSIVTKTLQSSAMEPEVALKEDKGFPNFLKKHRHKIYLHQEGSNRNSLSLCKERSTKIQRNILETVGNLNGVKPNERVVKCSWVKFRWEEVKCRQVK